MRMKISEGERGMARKGLAVRVLLTEGEARIDSLPCKVARIYHIWEQ